MRFSSIAIIIIFSLSNQLFANQLESDLISRYSTSYPQLDLSFIEEYSVDINNGVFADLEPEYRNDWIYKFLGSNVLFPGTHHLKDGAAELASDIFGLARNGIRGLWYNYNILKRMNNNSTESPTVDEVVLENESPVEDESLVDDSIMDDGQVHISGELKTRIFPTFLDDRPELIPVIHRIVHPLNTDAFDSPKGYKVAVQAPYGCTDGKKEKGGKLKSYINMIQPAYLRQHFGLDVDVGCDRRVVPRYTYGNKKGSASVGCLPP